MDEQEPRETRETTVIQTGERSGGGGLIAAIVVLLLVGALAFFFFSGGFEKATDDIDVNVNVDAPEIKLPDIEIDTTPAQPAQPAQPAEPAAPSNSN